MSADCPVTGLGMPECSCSQHCLPRLLERYLTEHPDAPMAAPLFPDSPTESPMPA